MNIQDAIAHGPELLARTKAKQIRRRRPGERGVFCMYRSLSAYNSRDEAVAHSYSWDVGTAAAYRAAVAAMWDELDRLDPPRPKLTLVR